MNLPGQFWEKEIGLFKTTKQKVSSKEDIREAIWEMWTLLFDDIKE